MSILTYPIGEIPLLAARLAARAKSAVRRAVLHYITPQTTRDALSIEAISGQRALIDHFSAAAAHGAGPEIITPHQGETILHQGDLGRDVYLVLDGEVSVHYDGQGESKTFTSGRGEIIGEIGALLDRVQRTADVVVSQPGTRLLKINRRDFITYLRAEENFLALKYINNLIFQRLGSLVSFFIDRNVVPSIADLLSTRGSLPDRTSELPGGPVISIGRLRETYSLEGGTGLARVITNHLVERAIRDGDTHGLASWLRVVRGEADRDDLSTIFELFETGQTHIHPTRSLPTDFVMRLGQKYLGETNVWVAVEKKLSNRIRAILAARGLTIREVFTRQDFNTLRELIAYRPALGEASLAEYLQMGSFISTLFRTAADIRDAAEAVAVANYQNGVRYLELRFSADKDGLTMAEVMAAQIEGLRCAEANCPGLQSRVIIIFDTVMSTEQAETLADEILRFRQDRPDLAEYIVAIDTAGPEVSRVRQGEASIPRPDRLGGSLGDAYYFDIMKFAAPFRRLIAAGLGMTTHAGENFLTVEQGLDNLARAIELGTQRIGHGVILGLDISRLAGTRDAFGQLYTPERVAALQARQTALCRLVARRGIVVEVCPSSNLHTNAQLTLETHPFRQFMRYGIRFSVSVDNSGTDRTRVSDELLRLASAGQMTMRQLIDMIIGSSAYGFATLPVRTEPMPQLSDLSSRARLGTEMFIADIPQIAANLLQLSPNDRVAFVQREGAGYRVASANAYLTDQVGEVVELEALRRDAEYLHSIEVCDSGGKVIGLLVIANNQLEVNGVEELAGRLGRTIQLSRGLEVARKEVLGAEGPTAWVVDTAEALRTGRPITRVVVNLPLKGVNDQEGHEAGDSYIRSALSDMVKDYLRAKGIAARVYRSGANFEIDLPLECTDLDGLMHELAARMEEWPVEFDFYSQRKGREVRMQVYVKPNVGAWRYDPAHDGQATVRDLRIASAMRISELNRAIDSFAAKRVDLKTVRDYSAEERVVDKSEARQSRVTDARGWEWCHAVLVQAVRQAMRNEGIADPEESEINERIRMQYIEPDSGLYNSAAFEVISQAKFTARRLGEPLSVGYLDGNKIGAFIKSYGFLGDTMVDTIVCRRISSTASDVLAQYGVALFRVGPRSEEFYLLGNVSSEVMAKAVKRFNAQVNRPLKFKVTEAEMMATTDGARFMALLLRRPGVYSDSQGCYLHIDLTELPREEGRFSRLSFTGAVMNIGRNLAQTILTVIERAEAAKSTNETREYLLINLDAA